MSIRPTFKTFNAESARSVVDRAYDCLEKEISNLVDRFRSDLNDGFVSLGKARHAKIRDHLAAQEEELTARWKQELDDAGMALRFCDAMTKDLNELEKLAA